MNPESTDTLSPEALLEETVEIVEQVSGYGEIILQGLYLVIGAVIIIFLLHFLTTRLLYPFTGRSRQVRIIFGTMYAFVLVIAGLMILREIGFDVGVIGRLALWGVMIIGVLLFLAAPFLPRLPFVPGNLVEVKGILGTVDAISTFHTTLRKFDGTVAFIPNTIIFTSQIQNFSDTPTRRIELKLNVNTDSDLHETQALFTKLMKEDQRVLAQPEPAVFVMDVNAAGVDMLAVCWVNNSDWLKTRSDLWLKVVKAFDDDDRVSMSLPQQEVYVVERDARA